MSAPETSSARATGPLTGLRVLDLTTVLLGPFATQMLGDYGADVIKIESPGGDSTRLTGPAREAGMAAAFLGANRNKRSVVLDLKRPEGREALLRLADNADVLIYSIRPQKLEALKLDPQTLSQRNPRLIVVSIHGFGEDGPYAGRPAYDDIIQGLCGLAALAEASEGEPRYLPTVIADNTCALYATQAGLAAVVQRERGGGGCHVEVPMLECMVNFTLVEHLYGAQFDPPLGPPGYQRLLTPWRRPYRTTDGYVCVVPYGDGHWRRFFMEAGRPEVFEDARYSDMAARTRNIDDLYAELAHCIAQRSTAEWLEACDRLDIPAAPLRTLADLRSDPHLVATDFFQTVDDPAMGRLVMARAPLKFDHEFAEGGRLPPRLGEHTREVLKQAGVGPGEIDGLLDSGAAVQA